MPYDRARFGQAWADVDRNGCDTRNDVLGEDLLDPVFKEGTNDCKVLSGTLIDPYDGRRVEFVSGGETSILVQIDHVVALGWAWRHGADAWTDERRTAVRERPGQPRRRVSGDEPGEERIRPEHLAARRTGAQMRLRRELGRSPRCLWARGQCGRPVGGRGRTRSLLTQEAPTWIAFCRASPKRPPTSTFRVSVVDVIIDGRRHPGAAIEVGAGLARPEQGPRADHEPTEGE